MKLKRALYIAIPATVVIIFSAFYNVSGAAICLTGSLATNTVSEDPLIHVSKSYSALEINNFQDTLTKATTRVDEQLWKTTVKPDVYMLDDSKVFGLFGYNSHGTTISLPHKTCLLMGSKGQISTDIVAHELAHADLVDKLGFADYLKLPRWLDEGIAMQVDFRKDYDASTLNGMNPDYIKNKDGVDFYQGNQEQVKQNYAAAKAVVSTWIDNNDIDKLLVTLSDDSSSLRDGV